MRNRWFIALLTLMAAIILLSACSTATPTTTTIPASTSSSSGATLLQERCTRCHPLTFVEKSKHSAADWKTIVDLMISRGAQLSPDEETVVVNYLAAQFGQ